MKNVVISALGAWAIYKSPVILDTLTVGESIFCITYTMMFLMLGLLAVDIKVKEKHEQKKKKKRKTCTG